MHGLRAALVAVCLIGFGGASATLVHITPAAAEAAADDSSSWSSKQWNKMKRKWAKEKEKWADCRKEAKEKGLKGRKSWGFLKECMSK
jgi:hypothetical protein